MNESNQEVRQTDNDPQPAAPERLAAAPRLPDANRLSRLLAKILDWTILSFASIPVSLLLGFQSDFNFEEILETGTAPLDQVLQISAMWIFVYLLINSYHLWYFGQSLGKKLMKIAIVDSKDKVPTFAKIVGVRYIPFIFIGAIPVLSLLSIVDILLIFRADRRCLHDMLAGTRVVDVSAVSKPNPV